jgi:hypothetical protein
MKNWIQGTHLHKGALHNELNVPKGTNIPRTLLHQLSRAKPGEVIENATEKGLHRIHVTPRIIHQANMAINLEKLHR